MVRTLFGFLAATAEELRHLRRAIVSATAGGVAIALLLPIMDRLLPPREITPKTLINILASRKTLVLREPLVKKFMRET